MAQIMPTKVLNIQFFTGFPKSFTDMGATDSKDFTINSTGKFAEYSNGFG